MILKSKNKKIILKFLFFYFYKTLHRPIMQLTTFKNYTNKSHVSHFIIIIIILMQQHFSFIGKWTYRS